MKKIALILFTILALFSVFLYSKHSNEWRTYKNVSWGIELKYPPNWEIKSIKESDTGLRKVLSFYFMDKDIEKKQKNSYDNENMFVGVQVLDPSPKKEVSEDNCSPSPTCIVNFVSINGVSAIETTFETPEGEDVGSHGKDIRVIQNGKMVQFYSGFSGISQTKPLQESADAELYIDKISQTLKFTY